jgi:hypothetical protein
MMALAIAIWLVHQATAQRKQVFSEVFSYDPRTAAQDSSFVTPTFQLEGRASAVSIETSAIIDNQWLFVGYALVNDETGQVYEFGREVSYYHGVEDGESWSEGSRKDEVTLPEIPPGRYFLRIEPESEKVQALGARFQPGAQQPTPSMRYRVTVIRDVPTSVWLLVALILLVLPPIAVSLRAAAFEGRRWQESDHAPGGSSGGSDDED